MLDATIDGAVIALPSPVQSADELHAYIETLLDLSVLLGEPWIAAHLSEGVLEVLDDEKLYPLRPKLKSLFDEYGVVEYDVNTVGRIVDRFLSLSPSFQSHCGISFVLTQSVTTTPDIISPTAHAGLRSDLECCVISIAVLRKHCHQPPAGHSLVIRAAPRPVVKVRAQIHGIDHKRKDLPSLPSPPDYFEGEVLVCDSFCALLECLDESAVLLAAKDIPEVELAIRIALFKANLAQGRINNWSKMTLPVIGSHFLETCQKCCNNRGPTLSTRILRAIVETMNGQNMNADHALRTGKGGGNRQLKRGSDKAQRRDVDEEFHLHYWDCSNGSKELASVVYHNDFSIPE